jgi:hypothetical protein
VRKALLALSVLGFLVFGGIFILSFVDPLAIERAAHEVVRIEVERRVGAPIGTLSDSRIAELARKALRKTDRDIALTEQSIRARVPAKVAALVESAYASVRANLLRELRIFTASNAVAFALLAAVTWFRRGAALHLLLPAFVLVGAVAVTGSLYLFNQDWLHTIVFGDYVGLTYSAYLAAVALLLADVAFNRARVTTQILNVALHLIGSTAVVMSC